MNGKRREVMGSTEGEVMGRTEGVVKGSKILDCG